MQSVYDCSLEKFLGKRELKRLRLPFLSTIIKDKFLQLVDDLLNDKEPLSSGNLDRSFSITLDMDPVNQQMRKNVYQKKRDLLLKLAPDSLV